MFLNSFSSEPLYSLFGLLFEVKKKVQKKAFDRSFACTKFLKGHLMVFLIAFQIFQTSPFVEHLDFHNITDEKKIWS